MARRSRLTATGLAVLAAILWPLAAMPRADASGETLRSINLTLNLCTGGSGSCDGFHVYVDSASNHFRPPERYAHCVKEQTSTDFVPKYNGEIRHIDMVSKSGGSCLIEPSKNTWIVEVYKDNKLVERGSFWLGQDTAVSSYYADCSRDSPYYPPYDHMTCSKNGAFGLTLSAPGVQPTYRQCPEFSAPGGYCAIRLHLDSTKPCLGIPPSSFTSSFGLCLGKSDGTAPWVVPVERLDSLVFAAFVWEDSGGKKWSAYISSLALASVGIVAGYVPGASSDQFVVKYAKLFPADLDPRAYLASGESGPPGTPGGPLRIDFASGRIGADVYMEGYLQRKQLSGMSEVPEGISGQIQELPGLAEGSDDQVQSGLQSLLGAIPELEP